MLGCAGEQEKRAVNLEKVHAAAARLAPPIALIPDNGSSQAAEAAETEPIIGPVLPADNTEADEEDPYNLPVTHEVTVEGACQRPCPAFSQLNLHTRAQCLASVLAALDALAQAA